jgi:hypothetical protein
VRIASVRHFPPNTKKNIPKADSNANANGLLHVSGGDQKSENTVVPIDVAPASNHSATEQKISIDAHAHFSAQARAAVVFSPAGVGERVCCERVLKHAALARVQRGGENVVRDLEGDFGSSADENSPVHGGCRRKHPLRSSETNNRKTKLLQVYFRHMNTPSCNLRWKPKQCCCRGDNNGSK